MTDTGLVLILFVLLPLGLWGFLSLLSLAVFWLLFKLYFREYEMDTKTMTRISYKVSVAFLIPILNLFSFLIARRLFVKSGMEKKDALKISILWFVITIVIIATIVIWDLTFIVK